MNVIELLCYVANYEERPSRTLQLEREIKIGTDYHDKWFDSQKDHWLGWLTWQSLKNSNHHQAEIVWNRLKSSPMMFWLAECAQIEDNILDDLEKAAKKAATHQKNQGKEPRDSQEHGDHIRAVLDWSDLEESIQKMSKKVLIEKARSLGDQAYIQLYSHPKTKNRKRYRPEPSWRRSSGSPFPV